MASLQSFDVCRYGVTIRGMLRGKLSFKGLPLPINLKHHSYQV